MSFLFLGFSQLRKSFQFVTRQHQAHFSIRQKLDFPLILTILGNRSTDWGCSLQKQMLPPSQR
jgi:hypothetical protein